jgi:hypothetical protein
MLAVSRRLGYREAWRRLMIAIPVTDASSGRILAE